MSRATVILNSRHERERVASWAQQAASGTIVEFRQSKRSLDQNARLWACLTEIARKVEWHGLKLTADDWKDIFTAALRKHRFVPGIDAGTVVPLGMRTSDMTKQEFSDLLELINAFAAERGIEFADTQSDAPVSEGSDGDPQGTPPQAVAADDSLSLESGEEVGTIEAQAEPDAAPASNSLSPADKEFLIRVFKTMKAAVGPDTNVFKRQALIFTDEISGKSDLVRAKAKTIREHLQECCGDEPKKGTVAVGRYIASLIGVDEKDLGL